MSQAHGLSVILHNSQVASQTAMFNQTKHLQADRVQHHLHNLNILISNYILA